MIKPIQPEELPLMYPCAEAFFIQSKLPGKIDLHHWTKSWHGFLSSGVGVMLAWMYGERAVGVIAGLMHPNIETGKQWLTEVYWFFLPGYRQGSGALKMFKAFETWGKEHGAEVVTMGNMEHLTPGPLTTLYQRKGYRALETHWMKEL